MSGHMSRLNVYFMWKDFSLLNWIFHSTNVLINQYVSTEQRREFAKYMYRFFFKLDLRKKSTQKKKLHNNKLEKCKSNLKVLDGARESRNALEKYQRRITLRISNIALKFNL